LRIMTRRIANTPAIFGVLVTKVAAEIAVSGTVTKIAMEAVTIPETALLALTSLKLFARVALVTYAHNRSKERGVLVASAATSARSRPA